jgi:internalin A
MEPSQCRSSKTKFPSITLLLQTRYESYAAKLSDEAKETLDKAYQEKVASGKSGDDLQQEMTEMMLSLLSYSSITEVVDTAKATQLKGHLCLGSNVANEGDDLEEGVLLRCGLSDQWDISAIDFTGLEITGLRMKGNPISNTVFLGDPDKGLYLTTLVSLDLSECQLELITPSIGCCTELEELDVSENSLKTLPAEIGNLKKLKVLSAFKNHLSKLPDEIGGCIALEEVNFFNNKLIKVPETMAELSNLSDLNLGGNKLKGLPNMDKWTEMTKFSCHQNMLMNNPEFMRVLPSFAAMTKLEFLKMDMNKTLDLLPDFGTGMTSLEHFEINACSIKSLQGKGVENMTAMKTFNVQSQKDDALAELCDVGAFKQLDIFNLSSNKKLTTLPPGFDKCTTLRVCLFQDTQISEIPEAMGSFDRLERVIIPASCAASPMVAAVQAACLKERSYDPPKIDDKGVEKKFKGFFRQL